MPGDEILFDLRLDVPILAKEGRPLCLDAFTEFDLVEPPHLTVAFRMVATSEEERN